jgi:hypothetical protein
LKFDSEISKQDGIEPEDDQPEWLVKINNSQIAGAFGLEEE